jgi:hypothetical protein
MVKKPQKLSEPPFRFIKYRSLFSIALSHSSSEVIQIRNATASFTRAGFYRRWSMIVSPNEILIGGRISSINLIKNNKFYLK